MVPLPVPTSEVACLDLAPKYAVSPALLGFFLSDSRRGPWYGSALFRARKGLARKRRQCTAAGQYWGGRPETIKTVKVVI